MIRRVVLGVLLVYGALHAGGAEGRLPISCEETIEVVPTGKLAHAVSLLDAAKEQEVMLYAPCHPGSSELIGRKGVLVTRPGATATVIVMHGYTSNRVDTGLMRLIFPRYNLLLFDFRAHGEHTYGQRSTLGHEEVYDVFAAVDFIRLHKETSGLPIIGYGFSMGAATAIEAQSIDPTLFSALILDCPFDSSYKLVSRGMDKVIGKIRIPLIGIEFELPGRSLVERYAFNEYVQPVILFILKAFASMDSSLIPTTPKPIDPSESIKKIQVPCFFITCVADEVVPFDAVFEDYQNKVGFKWLWLTNGERHFGSVFNNPELYKELVDGFTQLVLTKKYEHEKRQQLFFSDVGYVQLQRRHARLYKHALPACIEDIFNKGFRENVS